MIICAILSAQQGHCDYPLTELGTAQAVQRGALLKDEKWGLVFSSDLLRAYNTTKIILAQTAATDPETLVASIKETVLLRELSFGVREGLSRALTVEEAKAEVARIRNVPVSQVHDRAESLASVKERQVEFLTRLKYQAFDAMRASQWNGEQPFKVLCVAHGGFIGQFLRNFCPELVHEKPKIGNCSLSIINVEWPFDESLLIEEDEADDECLFERDGYIDMAMHAALEGHLSFTCTADPAQFNMCIE